jgi:hypothetical protein
MNDDIPGVKIRMLKGSLQCFVCGLLGLLPVIGLPFAVAALVISGKVRAGQRRFWNPARSYWIWGIVCAAVGTILWSFILITVVYQAIYNSGGS